MKKKIILVSLFVWLILAILPLAMDWLIIGNSFPSNIDNSDWVGFFGGYIGAIIGSLTSLVGIAITIWYTNKQNQLDRELQVQPHCTIRFVNGAKISSVDKVLGYFSLICKHGTGKNEGIHYNSTIYIKNVGLGPALDFEVSADNMDIHLEHELLCSHHPGEGYSNHVNHLQGGDEAAIPITLMLFLEPIEEKDLRPNCNRNDPEKCVKSHILKKYNDFDTTINISYEDIFHNRFMQRINAHFKMTIICKPDGSLMHACELVNIKPTVPDKEPRCPYVQL